MATIIVGHFDRIVQLQEAVRLLEEQGFSPPDYAAYYLNPPGQHGLYGLGGDAHHDHGSHDAGPGAATGALLGGATGALAGGAAGLAIGTIGGPIGALAGSSIGAYLGALAGALGRSTGPKASQASSEAPAEAPGGPMLAVLAERPGSEAAAVAIFGRALARRIDRANGDWVDGEWGNFDPREPVLTLLERPR